MLSMHAPGTAASMCTLSDAVAIQENGSAAATTGVAVLDKLAALELARKAERAKRREETREQADPQESIKAFLAQFNNAQQSIEAQLAHLQQLGPQQEPAGRATAQAGLEGAAAAVLQLESRCATSAYFLPSFEQKRCGATLTGLRARVEAATEELLPKKRFAFTKKVARVKTVPPPDAPAAKAPVDQTTPVSPASGPDGAAAPGTGPRQQHAAPSTSAPAASAVPSERDIALVRSGRGLMGLRDRTVVIDGGTLAGGDYVLLDLQVRIHRTHATDFYLRVRSKPIIEHSTGVRFGPYLLQQAGLAELMASHRLGEETGMYKEVEDFGWIKSSHSPNWCLVPAADCLAPITTLPAPQQACIGTCESDGPEEQRVDRVGPQEADAGASHGSAQLHGRSPPGVGTGQGGQR